MAALRQTLKFRRLRTRAAGMGLAPALRAAKSHDEAYWIAAQAGLAYDADAGWYVAERPKAEPGSPLDMRLEGPHATLVAAEALLRSAGFVVGKRSGPRPGRGGVFLTYLAARLPGARKGVR